MLVQNIDQITKIYQQGSDRIIYHILSSLIYQKYTKSIWRRSIFHVLCTRSLECTRTQKATAWIFDPSEIQLKINLIDKEIQTIESLSTVPHFTLLEPSKVITSIQYVTDTITSEQKI